MNDLEQEIRNRFQAVGTVLPEDPEKLAEALEDLWAKVPASVKEEAELDRRSKLARENDTPDGYAHFYWCCTRRELPLHALYGWIIPAYFAHGNFGIEEFKAFYDRPEAKPYAFIRDYVIDQIDNRDKVAEIIGIVIEASRELTKTTAVTIYFTAFRIGHEPFRANLVIQVGDAIATDNTSAIARVIKEFVGWKKCFPHVTSDDAKGWGDKGYEVKQTHKWEDGKMLSLSEDEWGRMNAMRKDPTLLGVGYSSHSLIGKHPDGVCVVDDIHDETNTSSEKELDGVLNTVESVINYTFTAGAWVMYVGTPWTENDTLGYIKGTGAYISVVVPTYIEIVDGKVHLPEEWLEDTEKIFVWPEQRGEDWVRRKLSQTRKMSEFHRMILLNLKSGGEKIYKFTSYPAEKILWHEWDIVAGVDPTATFSTVSGKGAGVSHFAICYALKTPWNTIVIGDLYVEKVGVDIGERELVKFVRSHPTFQRASIEDNNAGNVVIGMIKRNEGLRVNNHSVQELGPGNKKVRQFRFLSDYLASGAIVISDADTPGLNILRKYLQRYPQIHDTSAELDAADALCMAVLDLPEVWMNYVVNVVDASNKRETPRRNSVQLGQYSYGGRR